MEPAPFFEAIAEGPDGGLAHWVEASDGLRLRIGHWPRTGARGTVLIFPGRTEYIEKYGRDARALAERGFAAVAIDWRGQGLAGRMLDDANIGHVGKFGDYQSDVRAMCAYAEAQGLPRPWYLLAHSMGGCIGLRALLEGLPVEAATFSGPMWGLALPPLLAPLAGPIILVSRLLGRANRSVPGQPAQTYVLRAGFEGTLLTSDPDMFAYMQRQLQTRPELALGPPSVQWLAEAIAETRALRAIALPRTRCVTFLGTEERIVSTRAIRDVMARWPGGDLVMIEGGEHEVLMETPAHRQAIFDRLAVHFA